jgi:tetratricopeptide (TPR) repeat protein
MRISSGLVLVLAVASLTRAQNFDDVWKELVADGQRQIDAKDFARAEGTLLRAQHEAERYGKDDWRVATTLEALGQAFAGQKKTSDAESAYKHAAAIFQTINGDDSLTVANVNFDSARLAYSSGRYVDALILARKVLIVYERDVGGTHLRTASVACLIGDSLRSMRNYVDAEEPLLRCASIREKSDGLDSLELADALFSLARTYAEQKKYELAEPRMRLVEKIREDRLGLTSPLLADAMEQHAVVLRAMGRDQDAARLIGLSAAIRRSGKK